MDHIGLDMESVIVGRCCLWQLGVVVGNIKLWNATLVKESMLICVNAMNVP